MAASSPQESNPTQTHLQIATTFFSKEENTKKPAKLRLASLIVEIKKAHPSLVEKEIISLGSYLRH